MAAMIGGETRTGQERLDAARAAAIAGRTRRFVRAQARAAGCGPIRRRSQLAPPRICPSMAMPPPTPVPRIAPNTVLQPAAAPSIASDRAKQLASLARRTGRASAASRSPLQRAADQPGGIGVLDQAGGRRDRARHADPDRGRLDRGRPDRGRPHRLRLAELLLDGGDDGDDRGDRGPIIPCRGRDPPAARIDPVASMAAASVLVPPRSMPMRRRWSSAQTFSLDWRRAEQGAHQFLNPHR